MSLLTVGAPCHLWDLQRVPLLPTPSHMSVRLNRADTFVSASPQASVQLETPALSPPAHVGPPQGCTGSFCTNSPHPPPDMSFRGRSRRLTGRDGGWAGPGASGKGQTAPLG